MHDNTKIGLGVVGIGLVMALGGFLLKDSAGTFTFYATAVLSAIGVVLVGFGTIGLTAGGSLKRSNPRKEVRDRC